MMKRHPLLTAVLLTAALSACSTESDNGSSGLVLPDVAEIVGEAKPAALGSTTGLLNRQVRSTQDVSALVTCSYGSASDILTCLAGNVLTDPVPDTTVSSGEQLFHWLGEFDTAMGELETRFADASPDCASADPVAVELSLGGYEATLQLQCREQSDISTRAFGVDTAGNTYLVDFTTQLTTSLQTAQDGSTSNCKRSYLMAFGDTVEKTPKFLKMVTLVCVSLKLAHTDWQFSLTEEAILD